MRRTTTTRKSPDLESPFHLDFVKPGSPRLKPGVIARYRVGLIREESKSYGPLQDCGTPDLAANFLHPLLASWDREVLGALFLDTRDRAIGYQFAYIGTLNHAVVEPRGILTAALLVNAAGLILFHNHPSGDPTPSSEDLQFTERMIYAGNIVGVNVIDHLVIGEAPAYVSLRHLASQRVESL